MLKPWREVIVPHKDVASGKYSQAEFAADLAEVLAGTASVEYQDPKEFFHRTYLTEGLRLLLASALRRTGGINGEPIIQLKTAFGGGKTHTMLAIFHLFNGKKNVQELASVQELLKLVGLSEIPKAKIVVLVGTALDPSKPTNPKNLGFSVNTLWGELAYQLGGRDAYLIVKEADQKSVAPGANTLIDLFQKFGPCIILIDELVAYTRNIYNHNGLPSGSFESIMTFVQNLTEAVKRSKNSMVIAAVPESNIEIGGEGGQAALERLENTFGRLEAVWKPVKANESFEIVRRRLFETVQDEKAREEVCRAFSKMYASSGNEFPIECKEATYLNRLREAYPIHPEVFDRLYSNWSTLERFQRTRGVLRLMAATIHELWVAGDKSLLIMPGSIPLDSPKVRDELTKYLSDEWNGIVDSDIDGDNSEPKKLDATNKRFGAASAARRVARTIFLGSAPSSNEQKNRGIENVRILLGVVQPNEQLSTFHDALATLSQRLTFLYYQGNRYWYDAHPNLRKTVEDRAGRLDHEEVLSEINKRMHAIREKGVFAGIHICPKSEDVSDDDEARLVVLSSVESYKKNSQICQAIISTKEILEKKGNTPRQYRNMLLFLAPDQDVIVTLETTARDFLAWQSVLDDKEALNLDAHQSRQATEHVEKLNQLIDHRLIEAYVWLLVPTQEETKPITFEAVKITRGDGTFVARASKQVVSDELLITRWSSALLKNELEKWFFKDQNQVNVKKLWEYFASYVYLPRLKDANVLVECIKEGLRSQDFFGYAPTVEKNGKYVGLEFGNPGAVVVLDALSVLIRKETAIQVAIEEAKQKQQVGLESHVPVSGLTSEKSEKETLEEAKKQKLTRFYGHVELDPTRLSRDAGVIAEEIVQHLVSLPSHEVKISLDIAAKVSDGIPPEKVRIILENAKTLKFITKEFEKN
ncbi:MAG: DUF499 domain-containing protein [Candidatus Diapherotrites archaeon]